MSKIGRYVFELQEKEYYTQTRNDENENKRVNQQDSPSTIGSATSNNFCIEGCDQWRIIVCICCTFQPD